MPDVKRCVHSSGPARPDYGCALGRSQTAKRLAASASADTVDQVKSQATSDTNVSLLGIGLMGNKMARRLSEQGFQVTTWNRDGSKADSLSEVRPYCI